MSYNTKQVMKNAWRITKDRGITCLRIRVPGGHLPVRLMPLIQEIAERYGNGSVHLTTRQGFEVPGIPLSAMNEVNEMIEPILVELERARGVNFEQTTAGYPAAGTRNVVACIGNRVCKNAALDTTSLAFDIETIIYPNHPHVKIAVTGCPNDCVKVHLQDIGIIGQVEPVYDQDRCIGCQACVKNCKKVSTGALEYRNNAVRRDSSRCIGCGECILKCPSMAWNRGGQYFRVVIMGRTGKQNPRLATSFLEWVDRQTVLKLCENLYPYIQKYIDPTLSKEHVGYIVDRTGYSVFKEEVLKDITLPKKAKIAHSLNFSGYSYDRNTGFEL